MLLSRLFRVATHTGSIKGYGEKGRFAFGKVLKIRGKSKCLLSLGLNMTSQPGSQGIGGVF
jgi:hypothetical protein